ncbi:hypothetical protein ACHWQZ_G006556 [Mnemiopsis leidyi]
MKHKLNKFSAGVDYKDTRLTPDTPEFAAALQRSPAGCLPSLAINGERVVCQSLAITRFVASFTEYNGKTPEETLLIDMFVETLYDLIARYDDVVKEQDPDMKVKKKESAYKSYFPAFLSKLEMMLSNQSGPFILGEQMTWGDIVMMSFFELKQTPQYGKVDLLSTFPKLLTQYTSVRKHPGVERWLNIRPKTTK